MYSYSMNGKKYSFSLMILKPGIYELRAFVLAVVSFMVFTAAVPVKLNAQFVEYNHPELVWQTIETEHFLVHFHDGLTRTPRLIARIAEEIYGPLTEAYRYEPESKVHFIVRDHDDYSNGVTYYYDNRIEIWATPLDFLLRGTNNWLRNVVTHELTHMIQLQTAMKMSRKVPAIYLQNFTYEDEKRPDVLYGFPRQIISYPIPGVSVPMWFAEGTAQYGSEARGYDSWDSHRDMILRVHALDKGVYSLDEMSVFGKTSIGNESVYNHGFSFVRYLARRFGDDVLRDISGNLASPFTFTINGAVKKATGISAQSLHREWREELEQEYQDRTGRIQAHLVRGTALDQKGSANVYPLWSPDGKSIAYLSNGRSDFLSHTGLYIQEIGSTKRTALKQGIVSPPTWERSGKKIAYSKLDKNEHNSHYYEIFLYDLETEEERQLTFSGRARYPVFSPDGSKIYYVASSDGTHNLYELRVADGSHRQLTGFQQGEELFNAAVSPDGGEIALTVSDGYGRSISVMRSDGTGFRYILKSRTDERDPSFSPDGEKLYYSSDRTGIYNIYEYDFAAGQSRAVTNVLSGAFMPSVNVNGQLVYSLYTDEGYKLARIDKIEYVDPADMVYSANYEAGIPDISFSDSDVPEFGSRKYTLQYMTTFVTPRIMLDYELPKIGLYSYSSDALDKYSIFLGAAVNREYDRDLFVLFDYNRFRPTIFLEMYNLTRHTAQYFPPNEKDEITLGYWEVDTGVRQKLTETQRYEFRALYGRQNANIKAIIPGILLKPLKYDYFKGLDFSLRWEYSKVLPRLDDEINPAYGREVMIEYGRNYDEIFEDFKIDAQANTLKEVYRKYPYNKLMVDWREYIGLPLFDDRSALTLHFRGGYIDRSVDDFLYFFAGGLTGLKGYTFYSLEGRKMTIGSAAFRFPLLKRISRGWGPWYFDKLYASVGYQAGDAWDDDTLFGLKNLKKGIDLGLRLDMFSYYSFPTKVAFNAAYGFDEVPVHDRISASSDPIRMEGKTWKFFLTIMFGYDLF
ncbi:DPP IV N-terminal domain-containing protein [candidate division KSB1 bacterium]